MSSLTTYRLVNEGVEPESATARLTRLGNKQHVMRAREGSGEASLYEHFEAMVS